MGSEVTSHGGIQLFQGMKLPSTWRFRTLGSMCTITRGASPRPAGDPRYFGDGTIPWIKIGDVTKTGSRYVESTAEYVNEEGAKRSVRIPPGSLIIANSGVSLGFAAFTKFEGCIHDGWLLASNFIGLDPNFLYYCVNILTNRLRTLADGTTQPNLNTGLAKQLLIPAPSLSEQKSIAHVLGTLDDRIELNRQMNETLEAMAQALFKSWFVDFDPVIDNALANGKEIPDELGEKAHARAALGGKRRPLPEEIRTLFPDEFACGEELSWIPKGWKEAEIREMTSAIQYGHTASASEDSIGPKFLRITDIRGGQVNWDTVPYCKVPDYDFDKYRINWGDIFVARTGASTGENIYIIDPEEAIFASYLVRLSFSDAAIARVVGMYMRTSAYFSHVQGALGGSAQPNASAQVLASAKMVFPPNEIAKIFFDTISLYDLKRAAQSRQSITIAKLRDALLPKLLSGELRIPDAEKIVESMDG